MFLIRLKLNTIALINKNWAGRVGFQTFCNPFKQPLKDYQLAFLKSAEQFTVPSENNIIQVYKWGRGSKKVLLLHGWASHSFRWKAYIEALQQLEYEVYAFDAPGHGLSTGKYLNLILYSKAMQDVLANIGNIDVAICHSFGGATMSYLLHHHKETAIEKVVIMGSPGEANEFFHFYKAKLGLSEKAMQAIIHHFGKVFQKPPSYFSASTFALTIKKPLLIVHDVDDDEALYSGAVALHNNWAGSILKTTTGLGHQLKSKELMQEVIAFCKG